MATGVSYLDSGIANSDSVSVLIYGMRNLSVVGLGEPALREVLSSARRVQAGLDALIYRVGAEADRLAVLGKSAPADEMLNYDGHLRSATAKREAARSRTVTSIAGLSEAVSSGDVGVDHIDSLTQRLKRLTDDERLKLDHGRLVDKAKVMPADRFDKAIKDAVNKVRQDHGLKDAQQKRQASEFRHWFDHKTGMGRFYGQLDPERYETLTTAIDQHVNTLAASTGPTDRVVKDATLAATALTELVCTSPQRTRNQPHLTVVVDHKTLVEGGHPKSIHQTGNGNDVPPETVSRLGCDSVLQKVVLDDRDVPINVGRKYRTATDAQWTAIRSVYSGCAWQYGEQQHGQQPGQQQRCERPLSWCQLHHITEWQQGGVTNLDNLIPLCNTHHHRVHEGKWSIKLKPDRSLEIYRPDQKLHTLTEPPNRRYSPQADR